MSSIKRCRQQSINLFSFYLIKRWKKCNRMSCFVFIYIFDFKWRILKNKKKESPLGCRVELVRNSGGQPWSCCCCVVCWNGVVLLLLASNRARALSIKVKLGLRVSARMRSSGRRSRSSSRCRIRRICQRRAAHQGVVLRPTNRLAQDKSGASRCLA